MNDGWFDGEGKGAADGIAVGKDVGLVVGGTEGDSDGASVVGRADGILEGDLIKKFDKTCDTSKEMHLDQTIWDQLWAKSRRGFLMVLLMVDVTDLKIKSPHQNFTR